MKSVIFAYTQNMHSKGFLFAFRILKQSKHFRIDVVYIYLWFVFGKCVPGADVRTFVYFLIQMPRAHLFKNRIQLHFVIQLIL